MWKIFFFMVFNISMMLTLFDFLNSTDTVEFIIGILGWPILVTVDFRLYKIFWPEAHK